VKELLRLLALLSATQHDYSNSCPQIFMNFWEEVSVGTNYDIIQI